MLFENSRVGQITVSSRTHELWGIRHQAGRSTLVYSAYPYRKLVPVVDFGVDNNMQRLAVSPGGKWLAATLYQASGEQKIILSDLEKLKGGGNFTFRLLCEEGSPEYPSWSPDESTIFWGAYTRGVASIYRYHLRSGKTEAMSHTLSGLFKPLYLNADSLLAFEFTSLGFRPVILSNRTAERK